MMVLQGALGDFEFGVVVCAQHRDIAVGQQRATRCLDDHSSVRVPADGYAPEEEAQIDLLHQPHTDIFALVYY